MGRERRQCRVPGVRVGAVDRVTEDAEPEIVGARQGARRIRPHPPGAVVQAGTEGRHGHGGFLDRLESARGRRADEPLRIGEEANQGGYARGVAELADEAGRRGAQLRILRRQARTHQGNRPDDASVAERVDRVLLLVAGQRPAAHQGTELLGRDEREARVEGTPPAEALRLLGEIGLDREPDRLSAGVGEETIAGPAADLPRGVAERARQRLAGGRATALAEMADRGAAARGEARSRETLQPTNLSDPFQRGRQRDAVAAREVVARTSQNVCDRTPPEAPDGDHRHLGKLLRVDDERRQQQEGVFGAPLAPGAQRLTEGVMDHERRARRERHQRQTQDTGHQQRGRGGAHVEPGGARQSPLVGGVVEAPHARNELRRRERLDEVVVGAVFAGTLGDVGLGVRAQDENARSSALEVAADDAQDLETVAAWHVDVEDHDPGMVTFDLFEGGLAVAGAYDGEFRPPQHLGGQHRGDVVVLGDDDGRLFGDGGRAAPRPYRAVHHATLQVPALARTFVRARRRFREIGMPEPGPGHEVSLAGPRDSCPRSGSCLALQRRGR